MEQIRTMKETKISFPRINHDYRKNIYERIRKYKGTHERKNGKIEKKYK
jgi:iron-sulfur cluster repair protein YtfE (RIC family)